MTDWGHGTGTRNASVIIFIRTVYIYYVILSKGACSFSLGLDLDDLVYVQHGRRTNITLWRAINLFLFEHRTQASQR